MIPTRGLVALNRIDFTVLQAIHWLCWITFRSKRLRPPWIASPTNLLEVCSRGKNVVVVSKTPCPPESPTEKVDRARYY